MSMVSGCAHTRAPRGERGFVDVNGCPHEAR
jgi:hypothetical protein